MFFIVNKTKSPVSISDLNIVLGPRQAIDLDKARIPRDKSEASKSLKMAQKNGDIEIRFKDNPKSKSVPITPSLTVPDLGNIKEEIIGEMKDVMKEFLTNQAGGVSKSDLQELINAMPKATETVIYRQDKENIVQREDEEVEEVVGVDIDAIGEMNKRAVNKMVENANSGELKYKQEKQENDLESNISELENLLG